MRHPDIRTCSKGKIFFRILLGESEVGSICKTKIDCPYVHARSAVMYLEAGCDTQTFEHAQRENFSFRFFFGNQRWVRFARLGLPVHAMCMQGQL